MVFKNVFSRKIFDKIIFYQNILNKSKFLTKHFPPMNFQSKDFNKKFGPKYLNFFRENNNAKHFPTKNFPPKIV